METRGTGLGLAIARLVVELMGGTIWCESELGRGSTFEFSVKLAEEPGDAEASELPGDAEADGAPAAEPDAPDAPAAPFAEDSAAPVTEVPAAPAEPGEGGVEDEADAQSESVKAQARIREVAASVGVNDENIEFDELLEMLLSSPGDAGSPRPSAGDGKDDGGKAAEDGKDEGDSRCAD